MKLLLTSSGIANTTIRDALLGLLRKPIEESNALIIPTAIYPFPGGADRVFRGQVAAQKLHDPQREEQLAPRQSRVSLL